MPTARLCALLCLATSAGCDYFDPTTIPASDTTKPWAVVTYYLDGQYEDLRVGDHGLVSAATETTFEHVTSDPWELSFALAAGVDSGGIHEVRMSSRVYYRCLWGSASLVLLQPWHTSTLTEPGAVGETVSNGQYLYETFRGADWESSVGSCPSGGYRVTLEWYARAEDFHGNFAYMGLAKLTYVNWGS